MRVVPSLLWRLEDESGDPLDPRLLPLLDAVAATRSLAAAVASCGISYRAAWGLLRDYRLRIGAPLVVLERGRGAKLSEAGQRLLDAREGAMQRLARVLPGLAIDIGPPPAARAAPRRVLRIAASHDLALAALANGLPAEAGLQLEVSFTGSLHALTAFVDGRADVAGFHVPMSGAVRWDHAPFLAGLKVRRDRLIRFVDRDQGLILAPGNPAQARNFRDVARLRLRFVNRQRGSGTRLLIDRMIADERVNPAAIDGYGREEFTHPAVAATVASGGADVGFGLRAAAAEYRLAFLPLVRERYFLAVRAVDLRSAAVAGLIEALRAPAFARLARRLPGYRPEAAGAVVGIDAIGG
jgi:molybdate transport repressor ModE-like protein